MKRKAMEKTLEKRKKNHRSIIYCTIWARYGLFLIIFLNWGCVLMNFQEATRAVEHPPNVIGPTCPLANVQWWWLQVIFKALPGGGGWWRRGWGSRAPPGRSWVGCRCASWFWGRWCSGCKSPCTTRWPSPAPGGGCAAPGLPSPSMQGHNGRVTIIFFLNASEKKPQNPTFSPKI